jgi:hypothetical protein
MMAEPSDACAEAGTSPGEVFDRLVIRVAELLPFPVRLEADPSYTGALFIDLGTRGSDDDPHDTASIDATVEPVVWVFDVEGGRETLLSGFGPSSEPAAVATWITSAAITAGSPAASLMQPSVQITSPPRSD